MVGHIGISYGTEMKTPKLDVGDFEFNCNWKDAVDLRPGRTLLRACYLYPSNPRIEANADDPDRRRCKKCGCQKVGALSVAAGAVVGETR